MDKMEIWDRHFMKLPLKRRLFVIVIGLGFFLIGLIGYIFGVTDSVSSFLIFVIGLLYAEMLKLSYRIENLEK